MKNKICSKCGIEKEVCDFHKWKHGSDGYKRECKECRKSETKSYYDKNNEKVKLRVSEYRKKNPNKVREVKQIIYKKDKERILLVNKLYRKNNREKINEHVRNRKLNDPIFKLRHSVGNRIRLFLKIKKVTKRNSTFEMVGCTPQELKSYLESKFKDGMSWENQGKWHIDHIIPLSSGNTEDEIIKLCHYTNLQPLWSIDNIKKGSKTPLLI